MTPTRDYLASYGRNGDFGTFRAPEPLGCRRGDRVVVRTSRGLELARVLRPASARAAALLPGDSGQLLRRAGPEDEEEAQRQANRAADLFRRSGELLLERGLPVEVLDAEVLLEGQQAVLHIVRSGMCDFQPFVSVLADEFGVQVLLADLTRAKEEPEHSESGCGSCGSDGGCGSCGSGGGCGSGSCGSPDPEALREYFAELRQQMERRTPLL